MPTQNTSAQIRICGPCASPAHLPTHAAVQSDHLLRGPPAVTKQAVPGYVLPEEALDGLLYKSAEYIDRLPAAWTTRVDTAS